MSFRDALLPIVDSIRGIPGQLGLRLYTVSAVSRTWSGSRIGIGTNTDVSQIVTVALGTYQVKVRQLTDKDVVASGSLYTAEDLEIGPLTPPYTGSTPDNTAITVFDPIVGNTSAEVLFNIKGPGYPVAGAWFRKIGQNVTKSFRYTFIVRRTAEVP